jgi:hypothetical protein
LYRVTGLPRGSTFKVTFSDGLLENAGGSADASSGSIGEVDFTAIGLKVTSSDSGSLNAIVIEPLKSIFNTLTGDATVPSGASVKLTNLDTSQTIDLADGRFTIGARSRLATSEKSNG